MRNPLARLAHRNPDKPTLRERLTATRERAKRAIAVSRILMKPDVKPAPAPNRTVLVNYSTWLWHERQRVCSELYPHLGRKAASFVLGLNAGENWHFKGNDRNSGWAAKPPATERGMKVLDLVGVDWRRDDAEKFDPDLSWGSLSDNGERPALPHGWPALDAELLEALDDLIRLDAAQEALFGIGIEDREGDKVPGYGALEEARYRAMERLAGIRAESLAGLQAKARALLTDSIASSQGEREDGIRESLLNDLLGITGSQIAPPPDPIMAEIEESRRLSRAVAEASKLRQPAGRVAPLPEQDAAFAAFNDHCANVLLKTVPRTAVGCVALARYALEYEKQHDCALDEDGRNNHSRRILDLVARSPLL